MYLSEQAFKFINFEVEEDNVTFLRLINYEIAEDKATFHFRKGFDVSLIRKDLNFRLDQLLKFQECW